MFPEFIESLAEPGWVFMVMLRCNVDQQIDKLVVVTEADDFSSDFPGALIHVVVVTQWQTDTGRAISRIAEDRRFTDPTGHELSLILKRLFVPRGLFAVLFCDLGDAIGQSVVEDTGAVTDADDRAGTDRRVRKRFGVFQGNNIGVGRYRFVFTGSECSDEADFFAACEKQARPGEGWTVLFQQRFITHDRRGRCSEVVTDGGVNPVS